MQRKFIGGDMVATHRDGRQGKVIATDAISHGVMTDEGLAIWPREDVLRIDRHITEASDGPPSGPDLDKARFQYVRNVFENFRTLTIRESYDNSVQARGAADANAARLTLAYFTREQADWLSELAPTRYRTEYDGE